MILAKMTEEKPLAYEKDDNSKKGFQKFKTVFLASSMMTIRDDFDSTAANDSREVSNDKRL
jgi:hypothetical protein